MALRVTRSVNNSERGQSLVEMTVGLVILLLIVMGVLDLGRLYFTYLTLQDAAGEAALYLSIDPCCDVLKSGCPDPNNAKYRAAYSADASLATVINSLPDGPDGFEATVTNHQAAGTPVSVNLHYPYVPITPIISAIANPIKLGVTASSVVAIPASTCS